MVGGAHPTPNAYCLLKETCMKSLIVKFMIVGLLAAGLLNFCPRVMPIVNQVSTPPVVHQPRPVLPPPGVRHLAMVEDLVFALTNQARRARGLAPLIKDDELRYVARAYSNDMLVRRFFDHTTPDGVSFDERLSGRYHHRVRIMGENIWFASGYSLGKVQKVAQEIVDDWMSSPGHRENILDPRFTHLGVGVSARHQSIRATQEFVGRSKAFNWRELITPWLNNVNKLCGAPSPAGDHLPLEANQQG
jgi:uncharacterized protein YkwD